jgi:hypothetical protein
MKLVTVERQAFDELLDRFVGFEGEEREAEGNIAPLTFIRGEVETFAELLNNGLCLFVLVNAKVRIQEWGKHKDN